MHGRGGDDLAVLDQAKFCGAATDIDVEDALVLVAGDARGAGTVGRQHRFHVMAGGGGDEFAALLGQNFLAMPCAFSRRSASPVRITTPVSILSGCRLAAL